MANGILNVLANLKKLGEGLFEGKRMLYDPSTKSVVNLDLEMGMLKNIANKAKPFVVNAEFLDLVDTLTTPDSTLKRIHKSETGVAEATQSEFKQILDKMSAVSHLYKLPYKHCWIEKEKPWMTVCDKTPNIIGYKGVYLWETYDDEENIVINGAVFGYDTGDSLGKFLIYPSIILKFSPHLLLADDKESAIIYQVLSENQEWSNVDIGFIFKSLGVILALNSPKIVSTTTEKMITKLANTNGNKKHVASDVIKVSVSKELRKQLNADKDLENEASRKGMRAHYVRGHFKVTRTGMFWWNAHIRGVGQPSEKTYELTP